MARKTNKGRFITLEGGEGAGKSTQVRFIAETLRAQGRTVVVTREPGGSPLAEEIRATVLKASAGMTPLAETLLMFAARSAHLEQTVLPALQRGADVICDRFVDSTYAYQGAGKRVPMKQIAALESMTVGRLRPQLTLVLDLSPEAGLARARQRGDTNRFEEETLAFMRRVRRCFLARARAEPKRCVVVNAALPIAAVQSQILQALEARL